jgi:hypothetical protein
VREGSGVAPCPVALGPPLDREGFRCRHVSCSSRPASRCRRALTSPRAPWHHAHHPAGKGSGVTTCPAALDPPPGVGGLWCCHMPSGSQPLRCARAFPRRLTSVLSWPHHARGAGSALNAYKTSHTRRMSSIKCVQDIDTIRQQQYDAGLQVMRNGQTTVQGDSTILCSKVATVSGDPSTRRHTAHGRDMAERHDMTFIRSSTSSLATPS